MKLEATMSDTDATLMTRMLFVDALLGVGVPEAAAGLAVKEGLAHFDLVRGHVWNPRILEALPTGELQELYTKVKLHEISHAS